MAVAEFSREELSDFKLTLIALLVQALASTVQDHLAAEGHVILSSTGGKVRGPARRPRRNLPPERPPELQRRWRMGNVCHSSAAETRKREVTKGWRKEATL